ncbi:AAEL004810-PA [Aedes aegypti]|nr:AAEL004810-PA [Aedes aegypti]
MQPQSSLTNPTPPVPDLCENSQTSVEESVGVDEAPIYVNVPGNGQLESISLSKKALHQRDADENLFLRFLELDETAEATNLGRTPFTITKKLTRTADKGFGFSVVWTHPPRIEKVEPGLSAEKVGILPGDYIVFVDKHNVVTMPELDVLNLIRTQGNTLQLEVFRRPLRPISLSHDPFNTRQEDPLPKLSATPPRLTATCSNVSLESAKRKLNLPQVAFTKEVGKGVLV